VQCSWNFELARERENVFQFQVNRVVVSPSITRLRKQTTTTITYSFVSVALKVLSGVFGGIFNEAFFKDKKFRKWKNTMFKNVYYIYASQERATQQLSSAIEDMVLSAFGFTRADQPPQQQQPPAVLRSTDLVLASRTHIHSQQQPTDSRPLQPSDASVSN